MNKPCLGLWRYNKHHFFRRFISNYSNTIYALSTNPGKAAIAIVRVSGPESTHVFKTLTHRRNDPVSHKASVNTLYHPLDRELILDHALTLFFKGPQSYTGEDLLELHLHGSHAVVKTVLDAIGSINAPDKSVRYAEAGEFSKRAFRNGRLDLTQVEGIRDLIEAETELQRQAAISIAGGGVKDLYEGWRKELLENIAMITALIDFSDDNADISGDLFDRVKSNLSKILEQIESHLKQIESSELIVSGIKMNFLGPPNAGKSSLLNLIVRREAAIVSEIEGTTRDVLEVGMDVEGYKIVLGDTAGLRSLESITGDHAIIEKEGIRRAKERFQLGDVVITVLPVMASGELVSKNILSEISLLKEQKRVIVVLNKSDLLPPDSVTSFIIESYAKLLNIAESDIVTASCTSKDGITDVVSKIKEECHNLTHSASGPPIGASLRVKDLIVNDVIPGLKSFIESDDVVVATSELQYAIDGIGKITGRGIGVEEILGVVFSSFCIGK